MNIRFKTGLDVGVDNLSKKSLAKNAAIIMILTILSKILGFGRESLIAAKYGTSFSSDIYVFSYGITQMLFASIGSSLSTTFIPMLSDYIENKSFKERNYFVNNIINITVAIAIVLCILGIVFGKYVVLIFGPGFATKYSPENFMEAITITRIMFISLIFIAVQNVLTGVLQAHNEFAIPASMSVFYNITIIIYLVLWGTTYGAKGLSIAIVIAFFVQMLIHIPKYKELGYKYSFVFDIKDDSIQKIMKLIVPVLIGASVSQINFLIDRSFASNLGEGGISTLNFANKLNMFVYGVFGVAISTVVYTSLSKFSAQNNEENYNQTLIESINIMNLIMIPATIGMIVLRHPLVDIVFKHGAFDETSARLTAEVLLFYAPGILAYGIRDIINRAFYALQDTKTPMINSVIGLAINIVLNAVLVKYMGITGLALATTISAITTSLLLLFSFKKIHKVSYRKISIAFVKVVASSAIMGIGVYLFYKAIAVYLGTSFVLRLLGLLLSTVVGIIIYIVSIKIFRVEEYAYFIGKLKDKVGRSMGK